jgi:isopenicillin N synthase-like dioxygenase
MEQPEFSPETYPPFPDHLKHIYLDTISLQKLLNDDEEEKERVFQACKDRGFFYLELAGSEDGDFLNRGATDLARLAEKAFQVPQSEKDKCSHAVTKSIIGYKKIGASIVDKDGTPDTAEFLNISKDDMLANEPKFEWPRAVMESRPLLRKYMKTAHSVGMLILGILATKLDVPPSSIQDAHKLSESSGDHVRLTRGPPRKSANLEDLEIATPSHTDFGSITILANWLGGLQLWSQSSRGREKNVVEQEGPGEWLWAKPRKGYAIVNLGDAAVKFTNGVFCSGRHRVLSAPGEQGKFPRYSVVYFVRPNDDVILKQLHSDKIPESQEEEEQVTAKNWILQQARGLGLKLGD